MKDSFSFGVIGRTMDAFARHHAGQPPMPKDRELPTALLLLSMCMPKPGETVFVEIPSEPDTRQAAWG